MLGAPRLGRSGGAAVAQARRIKTQAQAQAMMAQPVRMAIVVMAGIMARTP